MRDTLEGLCGGNTTPCGKRIQSGIALQQSLDETEPLGMRLAVEGLPGGGVSCLAGIYGEG